MDELYNRKAYSLLRHSRIRSHNRNAMSFFIEPSEDGGVRIHKQFYIQEQYQNFISNVQNELDSIDIKESVADIDFNLFERAIKTLLSRKTKNEHERLFLGMLRSFWNKHRYYESDNDDESKQEWFRDLNEIFRKYYYSLEDSSFHTEEYVYNAVNRICNYTIEHYVDFNDVDRPEIEPVDDPDLFELRIYNVGQANCSALIKYLDRAKKDYKVVMVFDFGYQRSGNNMKLDEMISKIDSSTTILISHFHNDHINNITHHLTLRTNRWLFPDCHPNNFMANKIYAALVKVATGKTSSGILYRFPVPFRFSDNILVDQYLGNRIHGWPRRSLINAKCLVCKISIREKDILIPGDALYEDYGDALILENNKKYDYILVPHHGCKYINKTVASHMLKIWNFVDDNTVGFVMCGKNNYGHANENHLSWFKNFSLFDKSGIYDDNKNLIRTVSVIAEDFFAIHF